MNEKGEDWMFQINEDAEDFVVDVVWFVRTCVMKKMKNMLYFNFAIKNFTMVVNINHSEI